MMEISIKLTSDEAEILLKQADNLEPFANVPELEPWRSIANKIRWAKHMETIRMARGAQSKEAGE